MKKIIAIIGARPQFIKHFSLDKEAKGKIILKTIHTGQHYDQNMSQIFFDELGMSKPDYQLNNGGGQHGEQTGKMLIDIEKIFLNEKPEAVVVYGDTNSTLAGALAAAKLHIPVAHIEAGIRSNNKKMPEEINRILTDHVSSYFFIPTADAIQNLSKEGITENIFNFGDIMKDVLDYVVESNFLKKSELITEPYYYATIHRPYNTDEKEKLEKLLHTLNNLDLKVVFAIHPRTKEKMKDYGFLKEQYSNIIFIKPQAYITNLSYIQFSEAVITDSGGIQKEAYWLKTRCLTIRSETEWTETLQNGWNQLCFDDLETLNTKLHNPLGTYTSLYSEGNTGQKIIQLLVDRL